MTKYKLVVNREEFLDNYMLPRKVLGNTSSRLLTHKEMYQSHSKTELAIPIPA
jgi:hypothetical protein